ncbi:MAG: helix-turn-helix transcriptional regulator [Ignavibacteria bacterium]|nr:helix-turn-helix transcriptional regulator [Ignavibacteria bacterium]
MKIESTMTDEAVLRELGERLERERLARNLTQAALAERAGVSKRTVERFESGEVGMQLTGFLRICRAMQVLDALDLILPDEKPSPMELLKHKGKRRQRATTLRESDQPQKPWTWGDES